MAIPNERKPLAISPNKLNEYIGQYQLAPDVIYCTGRGPLQDGELLP